MRGDRASTGISLARVIGAALALSILAVSRCLAHGHPAEMNGLMRPDRPQLDDISPRNSFGPEPPGQPEKKNPYEKMSCEQLYMLATQSQDADLAQAMAEKDCAAL